MPPGARLLVVFGAVAAGLLLVFRGAERHAGSALARYCDAPGAHVARLAEILSDEVALPESYRRGYLVDSKLQFLVPRASGEPVGVYLARVREEIERHCRI